MANKNKKEPAKVKTPKAKKSPKVAPEVVVEPSGITLSEVRAKMQDASDVLGAYMRQQKMDGRGVRRLITSMNAMTRILKNTLG
jgi:hypothetical protein